MAVRPFEWIDSRLRLRPALKDIVEHPVPEHVDPVRHPSAFVYCFGGLTFLFFMLLVVSGVFLAFYYVPSPDHAHDSVQYITKEVTFGAVVRGIHHWSASAFVVMLVLHMLRVFLQGAYKHPREMNWVAGVLLFALGLTMSFTGYLLPWDQKAYWATMVGTTMIGSTPIVGDFLLHAARGGSDLGAVTLARFYALHVLIVPGLMFALLGLHFMMVRRQGISRPL